MPGSERHKNPFRYLDEVLELRSSLSKETDRGCALMAAAYLDDQLERLLRKAFVDDPNVADGLLQPLRPLGSFSARIELAFAFGLLPKSARRDLNLIRKIRNYFSHDAKPLSFADSSIAERCRELHHSALEGDASPRNRFTNATLGVAAIIHAVLHTTLQRPIQREIPWSEERKAHVRQVARYLADVILERETTRNKGT